VPSHRSSTSTRYVPVDLLPCRIVAWTEKKGARYYLAVATENGPGGLWIDLANNMGDVERLSSRLSTIPFGPVMALLKTVVLPLSITPMDCPVGRVSAVGGVGSVE